MTQPNDDNWQAYAEDTIDGHVFDSSSTSWSHDQLKEGWRLLAKISPKEAADLSEKFGVTWGDEFKDRQPNDNDKEQIFIWLDELEPPEEVLAELHRLVI